MGNNGGEYIITFSVTRDELVDAAGKGRTLSLRKPGATVDDPPFFNLRLDTRAMRNGDVPGVVFDDFVFEVTPPDFGDAPDLTALGLSGYPTSLDNNGGRHLNTNLEWFGTLDSPNVDSVSPEHDAVPEIEVDPATGTVRQGG